MVIRSLIFLQLALIAACNPPPVDDPTKASSSDAAPVSVSVADSAPVSVSVADSAPAPVADSGANALVLVPVPINPPLPALVAGMMDHARFFGFSDDGATLGYCGEFGGKPSVGCGMKTGTAKSASELHDAGDAKSVAMLAKAKSQGIGTKRESKWIYDDLEITWSAILGDNVTKPGSLQVGVRKKGEVASVVITLVGAGHLDRWHPEFIGLSPDGGTLGAIGHGYGGEYSDTFVIDTISTHVAAARAYNDAGFAHHKKGEYAVGAALFQRAIDVDATHPLARYNLACAFARLHDPKTKDALTAAIAQGGAAVKDRAKKEPDFEGIKSESWFAPLVGP